jgi:hypothetical protein
MSTNRAQLADTHPLSMGIRARPALGPVAFGLALAGAASIALLQGSKPFYYDSGGYWSLAGSFTQKGHFSLLNFESSLRGYGLPLIYRGLQAIVEGLRWSPSVVVKLFNGLLFALIGGLLAPGLAELAWPERRWGISRRVALTVLLLVFWSGYLNFPLSDFPALAAALLTLVAAGRVDSPGWMFVAGASCAAAIDLRPEYLPLAPIPLGFAAWQWLAQRRRLGPRVARRALCVALLGVGFVAVSLPQSLSAHRHFGDWSFVPGAAANLTGEQLGNGLEFQRYDTYVGGDRPPEMFYYDEAGHGLLSEQKHGSIESVSQYAGLVADHPFFFAGLVVRHAINGLDERYSTPYIEHVHSTAEPLRRFAGFLLVFLAVVRVLWPAARRSLAPARWRYPVTLLLCCVTSLFTAVEPRYLLPAYLLSYMLVLAPGWPSPLGGAGTGLRRRLLVPAALAVAYAASMAVVWHVVTSATAHLRFG